MDINLKKLLVTTLFLALGAQVSAMNAMYSDILFSLKGKNVTVRLKDDAKGDCWTNLEEVESFVQTQLSLAGATVLENSTPNGFTFNIIITGNRISFGEEVSNICYANMEFNMRKLLLNEDVGYYYWSYMLHDNAVGIQNGNFNSAIMKWLGKRLSKVD